MWDRSCTCVHINILYHKFQYGVVGNEHKCENYIVFQAPKITMDIQAYNNISSMTSICSVAMAKAVRKQEYYTNIE